MISRICDICNDTANVVRYGLSRQVRDPGERNTTWGMGSLDMCLTCWHRIAEPKKRRGK